MSKGLVAVWIAIILTKNESGVVALNLSKVMNQVPLFSIHSSSFIYGVVFITEYTVNELEDVAIDLFKDLNMINIAPGKHTLFWSCAFDTYIVANNVAMTMYPCFWVMKNYGFVSSVDHFSSMIIILGCKRCLKETKRITKGAYFRSHFIACWSLFSACATIMVQYFTISFKISTMLLGFTGNTQFEDQTLPMANHTKNAITQQALSTINIVYPFTAEKINMGRYLGIFDRTSRLGIKQGLAYGLDEGSTGLGMAIWGFLAWYRSHLVDCIWALACVKNISELADPRLNENYVVQSQVTIIWPFSECFWKGIIGIRIQLHDFINYGEFEFGHLNPCDACKFFNAKLQFLMSSILSDCNAWIILELWEILHYDILKKERGTKLKVPYTVHTLFHVFRLKLFTIPMLVAALSSSKHYRLILKRFAFVVICHRKMIYTGNVLALRTLLKWKTLPLKHGTCEYSSLRTRMFLNAGVL